MKRRSFLAMLGLAPVVATSSSVNHAVAAEELRAVDARIGMITAGSMRSADGHCASDFRDGCLTFSAATFDVKA